MTTVRKTITLTSQQEQWVKAQIAAGRFTNDSEYIRDLIRRDREESPSFYALQAAIQEGLESGVSERTIPEIAEEAEARLRRDGRL
ncbi:MAG: type II toxin-antitoxin system ParD family antitoxin [Acidobacteriota bacterium]|nr:type II toxin-antitoxin system ParD family antitoxin [Acidobacteriota bacterium]